jgi:solute:Na+ symporter, SSS family
MNMHPLDWLIVLAMLLIMGVGIVLSRRRMRSVADFLAAGRSAGRYLLSVAGGISGLGAITIVGLLEMNYVAGFSMSWWGLTMGVFVLLMTVSGWVAYRFRQSRCLTLAEFFERRYSKSFRVFAGLVAFLSGIINFGIFPAVGARFFIHFCGLPPELGLLGLAIPTFPLVMFLLLGIALTFVFTGGQVAVIVTDFVQGVFVNVIFVAIVIFLFTKVEWGQVVETLNMAPANASLINPFKTSQVEDFNLVYFVIGIFGLLYGAMSWQGTQAYNVSAKNAHEAKMGGVLGNWRGFPQNLFLLIVPMLAYTVMRHPDFAPVADLVKGALLDAESEAVANQIRTPLVLTRLLPVGLMGAFAAVMLAAFISTHDTYLHSWGSIFIQDVIMPFREKPLTPRQHLLALRLSILGVAIFIFFFSLLFQQSDYIFLFFAITGAIFAGGSGAVIIGGLYWKRGTSAAAWTALVTGATIAVGGILIHRIDVAVFETAHDGLFWAVLHWLYEINGQQYWALAMFASTALYIAVSLLGSKQGHDLDRTLQRGEHLRDEETTVVQAAPARGWRLLGMGREFTRGDKIIYLMSYGWTLAWTLIFIVGTIWNVAHREPPPDFAGVAEPVRSVLLETEVLVQGKGTGAEEWAPAAARLDSVLHANPHCDHPELRQRLGLFLLKAEQPVEAAAQLELAVAMDPEFGRAWTVLAEAAYDAGHVERAKVAAELGVEHLDPVSRSWSRYWRVYVFIQILLSIATIVWFTTGGLRDLRYMFRHLDRAERDSGDDGRVAQVEEN